MLVLLCQYGSYHNQKIQAWAFLGLKKCKQPRNMSCNFKQNVKMLFYVPLLDLFWKTNRWRTDKLSIRLPPCLSKNLSCFIVEWKNLFVQNTAFRNLKSFTKNSYQFKFIKSYFYKLIASSWLWTNKTYLYIPLGL